jgi:hypothetical protein
VLIASLIVALAGLILALALLVVLLFVPGRSPYRRSGW